MSAFGDIDPVGRRELGRLNALRGWRHRRRLRRKARQGLGAPSARRVATAGPTPTELFGCGLRPEVEAILAELDRVA